MGSFTESRGLHVSTVFPFFLLLFLLPRGPTAYGGPLLRVRHLAPSQNLPCS